MKRLVPALFLATAAVCAWLLIGPSPFASSGANVAPQARIVTPQRPAAGEDDGGRAEALAREEETRSRVSFAEGEKVLAVLNQNFDEDPQDEQIVAYHRPAENEGAIYLAYVDFDDTVGGFRRVWDAPTAVTRPKTFSFFVKDLVGDRSICVVAQGMNGAGEQTMSAFRRAGGEAAQAEEPFKRIAELRTDGSITIVETDRSQAYQAGMAAGGSFRIATYGRDFDSANILDQIETAYFFDPTTGRYEKAGTQRVPGAQIEQRKIRQLLDGTPDKFEKFLDGLWYLESREGGPKLSLLFDPRRRELVFYSEDTQEVFAWQHASATRYGLYMSTQNISVTTLRRIVDIELGSMDTIRVKVSEDVGMKILVSGHWDGTYRKAATGSKSAAPAKAVEARAAALYEGADGKLSLSADGRYASDVPGLEPGGVYAFFSMGDALLLETRADGKGPAGRTTFRATKTKRASSNGAAEELLLEKVKLGVGGIADLHEKELRFTSSRPPQ